MVAYDEEDDEADDSYDEDDDETSTTVCPYCGGEVYEDAVRCPTCQQYLPADHDSTSPRWWIVVGIVVCLILVLLWSLP